MPWRKPLSKHTAKASQRMSQRKDRGGRLNLPSPFFECPLLAPPSSQVNIQTTRTKGITSADGMAGTTASSWLPTKHVLKILLQKPTGWRRLKLRNSRIVGKPPTHHAYPKFPYTIMSGSGEEKNLVGLFSLSPSLLPSLSQKIEVISCALMGSR